MEKSDHTTPWVFSLMRMMYHPGSLRSSLYTQLQKSSWCRWCQNPELIVEQFKHRSWDLLLMQMVSCPGFIFYDDGWCPILVTFLLLWMVSHPGHILIVVDGVPSWSHSYCCRWCPILVTFLLLQMVSHPGHNTRNARGGGRNLFKMSTLLFPLFYLVPQEILVMAPEMQEEEARIYLRCPLFYFHSSI